jgi:hypothetical protein
MIIFDIIEGFFIEAIKWLVDWFKGWILVTGKIIKIILGKKR